jgi:hypothetical protein
MYDILTKIDLINWFNVIEVWNNIYQLYETMIHLKEAQAKNINN